MKRKLADILINLSQRTVKKIIDFGVYSRLIRKIVILGIFSIVIGGVASLITIVSTGNFEIIPQIWTITTIGTANIIFNIFKCYLGLCPS